MKYRILVITLLLFVLFSYADDNIYFQAMKQELQRNMENLRLENLQKPCYISYMILDGDYLIIRSSLGSVISSAQQPNKWLSTRVMTGTYEKNNENFFDMMGRDGTSTDGLPIEENIFGIRRALWFSTDRAYKQSAELYEGKVSAVSQQNLPEDIASLSDFSRAQKAEIILPSVEFNYDRANWEKTANEISSVFRKYPGIYQSGVSVYFYSADVYFLNSEGTRTSVPFNLAALFVDASTQANDGEPIFDYLTYFGVVPEDLPAIEKIKEDAELLAKRTLLLKEATPFEDVYMGPVLIEGDAVGEIIAQSLFAQGSGLNAMRDYIFSDSRMASYVGMMLGKNHEDMIDRRFMAKQFSMKAVPRIKEFEGKRLIGSFEVDGEGVVPPDELVLIEEGMLKTLLNGRTPTPKISESNGHKRISMSGNRISTQTGPGVIMLEADEAGTNREALKEQLIESAKEEGLDFGIIIRKVSSPSASVNMETDILSIMYRASQGAGAFRQAVKPLYVYKVYVEDGREELVRSVEMQSIASRAYRDIIGWSEEMTAYNTIISDLSSMGGYGRMMAMYGISQWPLNGIMSSFIVPDGLLFENLELKRERRPVTSKPPAIKSPLEK